MSTRHAWTSDPTRRGAVAGTPRRTFIRLLGGGMVMAAGGASVGCAASMPEAATQAWREAAAPGAHTDPRRFMLAHALLAPNPHNRQPWIADLREPGVIHLICDGERLLPETDPHGRQILIGCGAFVELAVIAGAQRGLRVDVRLLPDGAPPGNALPKGVRVATLALGGPGSAAADALYPQIVAAALPGLRRILAHRFGQPQEVWLCAHPELRRSASMRFVWDRLEQALRQRLAAITEPRAAPFTTTVRR